MNQLNADYVIFVIRGDCVEVWPANMYVEGSIKVTKRHDPFKVSQQEICKQILDNFPQLTQKRLNQEHFKLELQGKKVGSKLVFDLSTGEIKEVQQWKKHKK